MGFVDTFEHGLSVNKIIPVSMTLGFYLIFIGKYCLNFFILCFKKFFIQKIRTHTTVNKTKNYLTMGPISCSSFNFYPMAISFDHILYSVDRQ